MSIKIFYDGTNIKDNCGDHIYGFTTNVSFLKAAGITDYESFIKESLKYSNGRPISFQLFDDDDESIEQTAKKISSYDDSIFVKIPVIKTNSKYNSQIIKKLHNENIKINITAIFTKGQIDSLDGCLGNNTETIVSILAGRINDCGVDSFDVVNHASKVFENNSNVNVLWAACRSTYNIVEAENQGADIVTVPENVLSRMHRLNESPEEASLNTVKQFKEDGINSGLKFNL